MNLAEAVREEHRAILDLTDAMLDKYQSWPIGEHGARKAVDALVAIESRHEAAEARYLWPVVRDTLPALAEIRAAAEGQERATRKHLHRLHKVVWSEEGMELASLVGREVVAHVNLEQTEILPALEATLSPNVSARIGRLYLRASATGPTRPHPHTPAIPGVLAMVAPLASRVDRIRDLLRMR